MDSVQYLTQAQCAAWLGISTREVHNLIRAGIPRQVRRGRVTYPWPECNVWYREHKLQQQRADSGSSKAKIVDLQARKLELELRSEELKLNERAGELVTIDYLEQQVQLILQQLRSKLRNVPGQYATQLVGIKTIAESQARLHDIVNDIQSVLADSGDDPELDADGRDDGERESRLA